MEFREFSIFIMIKINETRSKVKIESKRNVRKKLIFGWIVSLALCNLSRLVLPLLPNFYLREREKECVCVCVCVCVWKKDR
jgi:hypothetical protein